jgi:DNA modification methylase
VTSTIHIGDCREVLRTLASGSINTCITSPPYFGLRDYGVEGQMGLEASPDEFVAELVAVFREVRRVLRDDGTLWLNIGDSYAGTGGQTPQMGKLFKGRARQRENVCTSARIVAKGLKPKDLVGIPWMLAFALRADGWYLRQEIIWHKPNPMPESVRDRCTRSHEQIFLLSKSSKYYFDAAAIAEPAVEPRGPGNIAPAPRLPGEREGSNANTRGHLHKIGPREQRNKRSVWSVATSPYREAHFATFPPALIEPCILAGSPAGGVVLDPFGGAGTTAVTAEDLGRDSILIELKPDYAALSSDRVRQGGLTLKESAA